MPPCPTGPAISFNCPEEADHVPSGIWDISRPLSCLRMRHHRKDAASPRKCGVRRCFAAPSDQRMALNFARKSRVKKPFWMRSPNEPFAPTLCRV